MIRESDPNKDCLYDNEKTYKYLDSNQISIITGFLYL